MSTTEPGVTFALSANMSPQELSAVLAQMADGLRPGAPVPTSPVVVKGAITLLRTLVARQLDIRVRDGRGMEFQLDQEAAARRLAELAPRGSTPRMRKSKTAHVVLDTAANEAACKACGGRETLPLPAPVAAFVKWGDYFVEKHRLCAGETKGAR